MLPDCSPCSWPLWVATGLALLAVSAGHSADTPRDRYVIPDPAAFLKLLDLARPDLADVKAALDRNDVAAAGQVYTAHFRQKQIASPLLTGVARATPRHRLRPATPSASQWPRHPHRLG